MPKITLENIIKRWDKFYAVDNLNLVIDDNAFVTLLGPSGCGKTTTLRMIAGLETPTSGKITIGDRVVFDSEEGINIPANKRKVGFLFQNYALWPNMTVYENISFGLKNVKEEMDEVDFEARTANRLAEILARPEEVVKIVDECYDKKGKIDENKLNIKLIDRFEISTYSAKKLMGYKLQNAKDLKAEAKKHAEELKKIVEDSRAHAVSQGLTLADDFTVLKDGKPLRKERRLSKEEIDLAVRRVSRIVKIGMFMDRYPAELSGGQQQRVAIARTLAPEPSVLFMDEPLSNLDAKLRLEMRSELQRLHLETGSTFVYVTHDQMEAMTLATRICLIDNGVLQQYDAPLDVYNKPNNLFVADFVGNPAINFIEAKGTQNSKGELDLTIFDDKQVTFRFNEPLSVAEWYKAERQAEKEAQKLQEEKAAQKNYVEKGNKDTVFKYHLALVDEVEDYGDEVVLTDEDFVIGVRPEFIAISPKGKLAGEIYSSMPTGMETTVRVAVGNYILTGVMFGGVAYKLGEKASVDFKGDEVILFSRSTGKIIGLGSLSVK
ncbi:MAG: ATP-binding cassette domain-containing protein [Erysipelotrichaceae bacterium]|nr:ATP-binding cassette domain-containing protein [Erysipelotrichaceae bacterium]